MALWAITDDGRLMPQTRGLIGDPLNMIAVSVASVWEITIKYALGRGVPNDMPVSGDERPADRGLRRHGDAGVSGRVLDLAPYPTICWRATSLASFGRFRILR